MIALHSKVTLSGIYPTNECQTTSLNVLLDIYPPIVSPCSILYPVTELSS